MEKDRVKEAHQKYSLPDGRQLGFSVVGKGTPVLYFHGTASSRLETLLLKEFAETNKFRIIGVDRPGYGLSTFAPRKKLGEFATDLNNLTAHLGLEKSALLAWSGGGPFALTYVALFPESTTKAIIAGSPALPFDVATAHNNSLVRFAMKIPPLGKLALNRFKTEVLKANRDINAFLKSKSGRKMLEAWPKEDAKFFADPSWLKLMYHSMAEAFRQENDGVKTVFQEHQLFMKPWAEPISRIPPGKVYVWHGTEDTTCRLENAYKIRETIPNACLEIFEGKGHCIMFDNLPKLQKILRSE
jgi:pimeloyl-ACP methyl ester carboxylesterase